MRHEWMLHWPSHFDRCQNGVRVDRRTAEDFVPERVRQCVQDGGTPSANGRLTDTASADGRLRIRNIQSLPFHVYGDIQNRWRPAVVEPFGDHRAVVGAEDPLLADRMADAQRRSAQDLPSE